jgi:hypothetical protein
MLQGHDDFPPKKPTLAITLGPMVESRLYKIAHRNQSVSVWRTGSASRASD